MKITKVSGKESIPVWNKVIERIGAMTLDTSNSPEALAVNGIVPVGTPVKYDEVTRKVVLVDTDETTEAGALTTEPNGFLHFPVKFEENAYCSVVVRGTLLGNRVDNLKNTDLVQKCVPLVRISKSY